MTRSGAGADIASSLADAEPCSFVDDVAKRFAAHEATEVVNEDVDDVALPSFDVATDVWRDDDVGHRPQRRIRWKWFFLEHVQRGAAEPSVTQRADERLLVDGGPPPDVQEDRPRLD